ncbi:MAG: cadmium-translocating P-type ATPase [Selenomonadaceae bacterium]|nr:cadmium-translocating P-type ATPase [Selenomonadaceae bacterium]
MIILQLINPEGTARFFLYMIPYLVVGYDLLIEAAEGIKEFRPLDENFLMAVATIGAICLALSGNGDYTEAVAVMLFFQVGELFEHYAVHRSRQNISDLMDIRPDFANVETVNGIEKVDPNEVEVGTEIIIKPGEKIPIDGVVVSGQSTLDTIALTGESLPRDVSVGSEVISGCVNISGVLKVRTTKIFGESTASKILDLVENASSRKAKSEEFIRKFAKVYTPIVVAGAVALAIIPSLIFGDFATWLYRALIFLVISCPCALVISIPLTFFAGIGGAGHEGILIKGSNFMETLANVSTVVMDKTGTLTQGVFDVSDVHAENFDAEKLIHLAAHAERFSTHPIGISLREAYADENDDCEVEILEEIAGQGVRAKINGEIVNVGNEKLMDAVGAAWKPCTKAGTIIHVAIGENYVGHVVISDVIKPNAKKSIAEMYDAGIGEVIMLTGDSEKVAAQVAAEIGIKNFRSELLPADKVNEFEKILYSRDADDAKVAFVGDGINDAPVLSRADVGIAMGALGADAAIEAADVVLMDDDPKKISRAVRIAKKCMAIVKENIYLAIGVKVLVLILGAIGFAGMWFAIFADVGVMVLTVMNSIRMLYSI